MNLQTELCRALCIDYPIIQAGMAGGPTTVELVANVSNAGALGTLGAAYMKPEEIRHAIREIKTRTVKPFAVNLFCTNMKDNKKGMEEVQAVLDNFRKELGLSSRTVAVYTEDVFEQQFQVLVEEGVPIISTAFGVLPPDKMEMAKRKGIKVIVMITTVNEAILAEQAGADVIVAQGSDAGGHRSTFDVEAHPNGANIGTFSLVPQVADNVSVPVVAAGGVMDGRGLIAALALGAQGVQLGTRFLTSAESGAPPVYKTALLQSTEESTVITKSFSGRPARGIENKFIREFEQAGIDPLAFPTQNTATSDIRKEAARQNNSEYMSLWAGQGTRLLTSNEQASVIVKNIMEEAQRSLRWTCE
jgi:nitronate monooxygenase